MSRAAPVICVLLGTSLLTACQYNVQEGTSSHVATRVADPSSAPARSSQRQAPTPSASSSSTRDSAPRQSAQPAGEATTRVQVLSANPEQGVPLSDDAQIEVISLGASSSSEPSAAPESSSRSSSGRAGLAALLGGGRDEEPQAASETWLDRYPNLAEDLRDHQELIQRLEQEAQAYRSQVSRLRQQVERNWGEEGVRLTSAHQFVKYLDGYQSRGEMDFDQGRIIIETVDQRQPQQRMREAIITTLLTPYDADDPQIYTDRGIQYTGPALLAGQVVDHEGQPVRWQWRAERFADHLVANEMQTLTRSGRTVYRVEIPLIENHTEVRGEKYEHLVRASARQYQVEEALIYAIMETESHFNPYAMSHIPAYGLMQIVPSTAGRDVFQRIKQRNDQPTPEYLFNPANNIDTGAAYLSILRDVYLKDIRHPQSREYAIISGYNGGAGNVLRTFHRDRRMAVEVINQLTPEQVYDRLHRNHPAAEARGYIKKVTEALARYRALARAGGQ